jgi:predicted Zn-dependent protease
MLADQTSTLEAETKVDELLEQHPDDPYLLIAKADFGVRRRDVDAGMMTLDRLEQLRPDSPLPPYLKAMVWHSRSQADRALVELKRALQRRPQHVPSLALASQVSLRLGHDAAALDYAQRALKQNQQLWNGFLLQAEALIRLNRHDEAIPVLQNVVRDQPGFVSGYLALATAYALSGQDEKALNVYREGRQQVHDDSKMALVTAEIVTLARAGRLEEARNVAEQSAGEQPESVLCLQLAGAFFSANERDDARRWGEQALELADEKLKGEAHLLLGKIALMEAEVAADSTLLAEARDHFSVVHQLQPANVVAANNLAWLLATHFDQVSEAVKVCEQACENISLAQLPVEFIDTLAVVYRKADRLDDALSVLQDAITHFPNEPIFHFQLGMTLALAGKKDTAIEALQRALELGLPDKRTTEARRQLAVLQDE